MRYSLGVDIGTTFSAAAVCDDRGVIELITLGGRTAAIPSVIVLRESGELLVGDVAESRSSIDPTRVAREFKRRLGDPTPLILGGTPYSPQALTSALIRHVYEFTVRRMGEPPQAVVITHPASYSDYRLDLLHVAAVEAGIAQPILVSEPRAAAAHYESRSNVLPGETIAVYDFGGGTFDIALMEHVEGGFRLIGAPVGVDSLGGSDFDVAVLQHVNDRVDGALESLDSSDESNLALLARLRRDCRDAKETLSSDQDATIPVFIGGTTQQITVTREDFERLIRPRVSETFVALRRAVDGAGITLDDIDRIVLVGGSSHIPSIRDRVRKETGRPVAEDVDPEYAVALGAARLAGLAPVLAVAEAAATEALPVVGATDGQSADDASASDAGSDDTPAEASMDDAPDDGDRRDVPTLVLGAVSAAGVAGSLDVAGVAAAAPSSPAPPADAGGPIVTPITTSTSTSRRADRRRRRRRTILVASVTAVLALAAGLALALRDDGAEEAASTVPNSVAGSPATGDSTVDSTGDSTAPTDSESPTSNSSSSSSTPATTPTETVTGTTIVVVGPPTTPKPTTTTRPPGTTAKPTTVPPTTAPPTTLPPTTTTTPPPTTANVFVHVGDTNGVSQSGVTLQLNGSISFSATTNSQGLAQFGNVPNGSYTLSASKPGFAPAQVAFTMSGSNRNQEITIVAA